MEEFVENFYSFEDQEEVDFKTLEIGNSIENDESEINVKDKETVTLGDPITNETVVIDLFMILKAVEKSKNGYSQI